MHCLHHVPDGAERDAVGREGRRRPVQPQPSGNGGQGEQLMTALSARSIILNDITAEVIVRLGKGFSHLVLLPPATMLLLMLLLLLRRRENHPVVFHPSLFLSLALRSDREIPFTRTYGGREVYTPFPLSIYLLCLFFLSQFNRTAQ